MEQRLRLVQGTNTNRYDNRAAERRPVSVPGQIVWKDAKGTTRMASVVTRDVSESGVSVECLQGPAIPLYRIVYFQVDKSARCRTDLPPALRASNVLSAVFRVGDYSQRTGSADRVRAASAGRTEAAAAGRGADAGNAVRVAETVPTTASWFLPARDARRRRTPTAGIRRRRA